MPNFMGMANQNASSPPQTTRYRSYFTAFSPGDTSWICPATGYYTITGRGPGAPVSATDGGGSGAAAQVTALFFSGQVVTFIVGQSLRTSGAGTATSTVITLPSGRVVTAGRGIGTAGGTASGGDTNINGNTPVGGLGGAAPAIGLFPAVAPAGSNTDLQSGVGAGGSTNGSSTRSDPGPGIIYLQAGKV